MLKLMQYVFPMVVQIEMEVIKKYGFPDNREGKLSKLEQTIVIIDPDSMLITHRPMYIDDRCYHYSNDICFYFFC